jgi:hypothetical protein
VAICQIYGGFNFLFLWRPLLLTSCAPPEESQLAACCLLLAAFCRGAGKKNPTDPPVHLLNLGATHPPPDFFLLTFSFSAFSGVSRQGEFKNTTKKFFTKAKKKFKNFDKILDVSFSSTFFCFIVFSGIFQR